MTFNNIINHLKLWCVDKAMAYHQAYEEQGGVLYVGYLVTHELEWKLSALIDRKFYGIEDLRREVLKSIDVHYEPYVLKPKNKLAKHIIDEISREFCEFFEELLAKKESLAIADVPYSRVIVGSEAATLQDRFRTVWGYAASSYWFPLKEDKTREIPEKFFVMFNRAEPYMKEIEKIIGLPETHIYRYGESIFGYLFCLETVELIEYNGLETIYTDKDFSWAIYFSHEDTVSFAGAIVPRVKELLGAEREHWDKWE